MRRRRGQLRVGDDGREAGIQRCLNAFHVDEGREAGMTYGRVGGGGRGSGCAAACGGRSGGGEWRPQVRCRGSAPPPARVRATVQQWPQPWASRSSSSEADAVGVGVVRVAAWTFRMGTDGGRSSAGPARVGMREGAARAGTPARGGAVAYARRRLIHGASSLPGQPSPPQLRRLRPSADRIRPGCTVPRRAPEKPAVPGDLLRLSHVVRRAWSRPSARAV